MTLFVAKGDLKKFQSTSLKRAGKESRPDSIQQNLYKSPTQRGAEGGGRVM